MARAAVAALFTSAEWAALKKKVIIATKKMRADQAKTAPDDKLKRLADAIQEADFGAEREAATRKLFEIFTGKKLPGTVKSNGYVKLALVVLTKNPNSHSYPLHQPLLAYDVAETRFLYKGSGGKNFRVGNHASKFQQGARIATDAEIEEFFRVIPTGTDGDYADTARRYAATLKGRAA